MEANALPSGKLVSILEKRGLALVVFTPIGMTHFRSANSRLITMALIFMQNLFNLR